MEKHGDGRIALITGAAGGIGGAISVALASVGATVVLTDLIERLPATESTIDLIRGRGGRARTLPLDVADGTAAESVVREVVSDLGSLDVLVNNAAWRRPGPALETAAADWNHTIAVTLGGTFFCSVAAARRMRPGGRIVNVASQLGLVGLPDAAAYSAAKGGVVNLTRSLALEWADRGITVNAVAPGPIDTPLLRDRLAALDETESDYSSRIPVRRLGTPADVASAVVFLASADASFITGHTLVVDGGWTAA